jgi:hypothetical protein
MLHAMSEVGCRDESLWRLITAKLRREEIKRIEMCAARFMALERERG